jgi:hypothetical protein
MLFMQVAVQAQTTTTWDGSASTDWANASNWDNGVPDETMDVIIPASGVTHYPVVTVHPGKTKDLTIESGASVRITMNGSVHVYGSLSNSGTLTNDHMRSYGLIVDGDFLNDGSFENTEYFGYATAEFSIAGDLTNNGTFSSVEHFLFDGASLQTIGGTATPVIGSIRIANAAGVQLANDLSITARINFMDGKLFLGDHDLTIDASTIIEGEDENRYVVVNGTGGITYTNVGGTVYYPLGTSTDFSPLTLYNSGTSDNFTVHIADQILENGTSGPAITHSAVNKTWFIEEGIPGGSNVALTFEWTTSMELPLFDRDACAITHHNGTSWETLGILNSASASGNPGTDYRRQVWGVTSFSPFGVGSGGSVLPVVLTRFEAAADEQNILLEWETAGELNNDFFEVEHSTDGIAFTRLVRIDGQGTIEHTHAYNHIHTNPGIGVHYYRLKQVDFDGSTEYSELVHVLFAGNAETADRLVDCTINGQRMPVWIHAGDNSGAIEVGLINSAGQTLYRDEIRNSSHTLLLTVNQALSPGIYQLVFRTMERSTTRKVAIY